MTGGHPGHCRTVDEVAASARHPRSAWSPRQGLASGRHLDDTDAINAISALVAAGHRVIVDTGTDHDVLHGFDPLHPQRLLVTRPCYLALRRAIGMPFVPDHVVSIAEHQRGLAEGDVSRALALPVTSVPYDQGGCQRAARLEPVLTD